MGDKRTAHAANSLCKRCMVNSGKFDGSAERVNRTPLYDCWLKRHGKEEAEKRLISFKQKLSLANSGKNNNMYGKPSPQGAGNGWAGWYKGWYFRSLLELSYMVNVIESGGLRWESAEKRELMITYTDYEGKIKNYFADFLINKNTLVECKPKRLWNTPKVTCKKTAAENFCKINNMVYQLTDTEKISYEQLKKLYDDGLVKFLSRYEEKFLKYRKE
jgi:hypothetical protein